MLGISQLLEAFLFELKETSLKDFLFVVFMGELHEEEDIVVLSFGSNVISNEFEKGF